jgi:hypothetical protein
LGNADVLSITDDQGLNLELKNLLKRLWELRADDIGEDNLGQYNAYKDARVVVVSVFFINGYARYAVKRIDRITIPWLYADGH